jgi:CheY-like chemotaxis protein
MDYKDVSIVAFIAYIMEEYKENFIAEGCTHYMPKPFTKKQLLYTVRQTISDIK